MIILTDQEIKDLSLTTLQLPLIISNPVEGESGLVETRQTIIDQKANLLTIDTQNKIFTDHWISVLVDYYSEREALDKTVNTLYDEATIILGGQNKLPHYDDTSWFNLVPIVNDSIIGNPVSVGLNPDEDEIIVLVDSNISDMVNGFGGVEDSTLSVAYSTGSGTFSSTGTFAIGAKIVIDDGTNSLLATVTDDSLAPIYSINVISTDKAFLLGDRVRDFHSGFTNAERGHQGAPNYAFDVMVYFQDTIDAEVINWNSNLDTQALALGSNGDLLPANQVLNTTALNNVNNAITDIDSWEATILVDVNGRFTDTSLLLITAHVSGRPVEISSRVANIITNLGPLVQSGDGSVLGTGVYASLYEFVNIRIGKAGGTLFGFYNIDLSINFFDIKIATAQGQLVQYNNTFAIASIIADTVIGQIEFEVDSVAEFSVSQEVKVMDNDSIVFTRTIATINGTTIKLNSGITASLTVTSVARIVRVK